MTKRGFNLLPGAHPIVSIMIGDAALAAEFAEAMQAKGDYMIGFSYPVMPERVARVRTQIPVAHSRENLGLAANAFAKVKKELIL